MKKLASLCLLLFLCPPLNTPAQQSSDLKVSVQGEEHIQPSHPLTNESIVGLVNIGFSDETIVNMIEHEPGNYCLAPADVIALKEAGVSEKVIRAMLTKPAGGQATARVAPVSQPLAATTPVMGEVATVDGYKPTRASTVGSDLGTIPLVSLGQGHALVEPGFHLEDGTPVKLRLQRTLSSADARVDDRVDFDVLEEIRLKDVVVIPKGSVAWGTVTEAQPKRRMARGGKLDVNIDSVRLADGEKAALRGVRDVKGGGHTGAMTAGIVATGLIVWPAAPFFLFMHGKDITIPKGTEITAYINGDMNLDLAKFTPTVPPLVPTGAPSTAVAITTPFSPETIIVPVASTPDGADITVDQKFMGSTPSSLRLTPGNHTVRIEKLGFKSWERTIMLTVGASPRISVTLEKQ
jgi:hypothetical protein